MMTTDVEKLYACGFFGSIFPGRAASKSDHRLSDDTPVPNLSDLLGNSVETFECLSLSWSKACYKIHSSISTNQGGPHGKDQVESTNKNEIIVKDLIVRDKKGFLDDSRICPGQIHLFPGHVSCSTIWQDCVYVIENGVIHIIDKDNMPCEVGGQDDPRHRNFRDVVAGEQHVLALSQDFSVYEIDTSTHKLVADPIATDVQQVSCGKEHVLLLTRDGSVYSLGNGSRGQLGHGDVSANDGIRIVEALHGLKMKFVCAGGWHSMALSAIGDVYVWGWNESGQLGLPSRRPPSMESHPNSKMTRAEHADSNEQDGEGSSHADTFPLIQIAATPTLIDFVHENYEEQVEIKELACGSRHSLALSDAGVVYGWGWNAYGQLGQVQSKVVDTPTVIRISKDYRNSKVKHIKCGYWNTVFQMD